MFSLLQRDHFEGQERGETVIRIVHRHWFDILVQYLPVLVVLFCVLGAIGAVPGLFPEFWKNGQTVFWFFETFLLMVMWVFSALIFVDYWLDVWIITDRRVVNVEQKGLFMREVSELRHQKIQDVTTAVDGFFPTLLDFGNVFVQTAAEKAEFFFRNVPDPYGIKAILVDLQKHAHEHDLGEVRELIRGEGEE